VVANVDPDVADAWGEYAQRLATSFRRHRQRAGLSQEQVAYRARVTRATYQRSEAGRSGSGQAANPTLYSLLALAQVFEITPRCSRSRSMHSYRTACLT